VVSVFLGDLVEALEVDTKSKRAIFLLDGMNWSPMEEQEGQMNPVASSHHETYAEPQVPPVTRSKWNKRWGSAFIQCDFEIIGSMVG